MVLTIPENIATDIIYFLLLPTQQKLRKRVSGLSKDLEQAAVQCSEQRDRVQQKNQELRETQEFVQVCCWIFFTQCKVLLFFGWAGPIPAKIKHDHFILNQINNYTNCLHSVVLSQSLERK